MLREINFNSMFNIYMTGRNFYDEVLNMHFTKSNNNTSVFAQDKAKIANARNYLNFEISFIAIVKIIFVNIVNLKMLFVFYTKVCS